jgi:hypothetical protein
MILLALALQAAAVPALGPIGRQELPAAGCAAFLWSAADRTLVAMASADPARLRIALDGKPVDLPLAARQRDGGFGLPATAEYRGGDAAATLDLSIVPRADLHDGAAVPQATLRIDRAGRDTLVVPLAGLIGCRPA